MDGSLSDTMAAATRTDLAELLKATFGHTQFRPMQEPIIADALAGRDVFVVMPTGGGKSLCYQLPAIADEGVTIVVSPLIALMQNQVDLLQASGVRATFLNSTLERAEIQQREQAAAAGAYDLVYMAPERLMSPAGRNLLLRMNVPRFAIDEAHCISEWGHDFRPEYRMLSELREGFDGRFAGVPMMALTATATPRVAQDIVRQLRLRSPGVYKSDFERTNLHYAVRPKQKAFQKIAAYIEDHGDAEGIIYCQSRAKCDDFAERLRHRGIAALPYHAGMSGEDRHANQHAFVYGEARVMVATIAFGMGIDKPDVRFVIHADLPRHLEGYYQETGRAGRDGLKADCILFYSPGDRAQVEYFIEQKPDPAEREHAYAMLEQVCRYANTTQCRCVPMLRYFGQEHDGDCGHCDNCLEPPVLQDATEDARKLLSAVARTGQSFGLNYVIDVLRGSEAAKVLNHRHHELSVHGIGHDKPRGYWWLVAQSLLKDGQLEMSSDSFRVARLTGSSLAVLRGKTEVHVAASRAAPPKGSGRKSRAAIEPEDLGPEELALFHKLRDLRTQIAREQNVPPYVVFGDISLRQMASQRPTSRQAFLAISGVGETKLERYGDAFMQRIREAE
ncbi:MAG: DNA helicase RecQ [Phycisphaeraceae bacterium]